MSLGYLVVTVNIDGEVKQQLFLAHEADIAKAYAERTKGVLFELKDLTKLVALLITSKTGTAALHQLQL